MISNRIEPLYPHDAYIYKLHFDFDWEKIKPIVKDLIDTTSKQVYLVKNGKSSHMNHRQPHKMEIFKPFYNWLLPLVKEIALNKTGYAKPYQYIIGNSWCNVHNKDGVTGVHNHPNTFMVATTYLNLPKNGGFFEAKDPLEYHKSHYNHQEPNWMWKEIPAITGDILIFPGWLQHRTQTNISDENRWVLTTNFEQVPDLGRTFIGT
jgi:uncharacterized protein (TIGR02466 family)